MTNHRIGSAVLVGLALGAIVALFATSASAQDTKKFSASVETVMTTATTNWDIPEEVLARGVAFNANRWKPVSNLLVLNATPSNYFRATVRTSMGSFMRGQMQDISPFDGRISNSRFDTYEGQIKEFEATGTLRVDVSRFTRIPVVVEAIGGWTRFGIDQNWSFPSFYFTGTEVGVGTVDQQVNREYRSPLAGFGLEVAQDRLRVSARYHHHFNLDRFDSLNEERSFDEVLHENEWFLGDGSGWKAGLNGEYRIWKELNASASYSFRAATTENANRGFGFKEAAMENLAVHQISFGATFRF